VIGTGCFIDHPEFRTIIMRIFTKRELAVHDGKKGRPAYVACEGKVYDVTKSFLWQEGVHQVLHQAGNDFTQEVKCAPHGKELLDRFPVVGRMKAARRSE